MIISLICYIISLSLEFLRLYILLNKTPKVVSVGCVGLWKHNGLLSEFGKIKETGKMCHVMSIRSRLPVWVGLHCAYD